MSPLIVSAPDLAIITLLVSGHSDLQRGFIRAEVTAYEDLIAAGGMAAAKAANQVRLEGKAYVVQDGDILEIRFSV